MGYLVNLAGVLGKPKGGIDRKGLGLAEQEYTAEGIA
jgi:hypothetical protein